MTVHVRTALLVVGVLLAPLGNVGALRAQAPATVPPAAVPPAAVPPAAQADRWEAAIAAFEQQDRRSPPPAGSVVFVGSSSIRLWDLGRSFPGVATINRGFGGSQMIDAARYAPRIVTPYKPRLVVLYEGDNDLNAKKTPEQVAADFDAFVQAVRAESDDLPIVVIGCKPSPARWRLIDQQRELNRLLAKRCRQHGHCTFVDVEPAMLGDDGQPRDELFKDDKLHLNDAGYAVWTQLLQPHLGTEPAAEAGANEQ
jgi:lysophospholipase L1-like esterase